MPRQLSESLSKDTYDSLRWSQSRQGRADDSAMRTDCEGGAMATRRKADMQARVSSEWLSSAFDYMGAIEVLIVEMRRLLKFLSK